MGPGPAPVGELSVGTWWVFDTLFRDAFSEAPAELWWDVVKRQGGDFRIYAHAPPDPP